MTTQQDEMRAKFEHWASDEGSYPKAVQRHGESYLLMQTANSWVVWQAATAAHSEALAAVTRERDALREDAARLDALQGNPDWHVEELPKECPDDGELWQISQGYGLCFEVVSSGATLREAIDAARTPPTHPAAAPGDKGE
jgi:hypothetical protein